MNIAIPRSTGLAPIADASARILVLGSLPGVQSLLEQRYYAHPRNHFWWLMQEVFSIPITQDYDTRVQALQQAGVAVWDVVASGVRAGSLDTAIDLATADTNDFAGFLKCLPRLERILFNGALSERLFLQRVLPGLPPDLHRLERHRLPSTSPANAATRPEAKLQAWRRALEPGHGRA